MSGRQRGHLRTGGKLILWKKLDDAIKGVVDNITLEDLMNWQAVKADEYVI